jgi:hypothetical protein
MSGWIGVDLDGTLAEYGGWKGPTHIGRPIPRMVERVKAWLAEGKDVRIFTARAYPYETSGIVGEHGASDVWTPTETPRDVSFAVAAIQDWCTVVFGQPLPVTCVKDFGMIELWDDRAIQVRVNTGERADGTP